LLELTPAASRVRVLIAKGSAVMTQALCRVVESAPWLQVCGTARQGPEALEKIRDLHPDVVILGVEMPGLNGIEVLKRIMRDFPCPVIMVGAPEQGAEVILEALGIGAFDYLSKLESGHAIDPRKLKRELIVKIEAAAKSPLAGRGQAAQTAVPPDSRDISSREQFPVVPEIVVLGTSTGGPRALQEILPELPADLPVAMIIVQHMPLGFTAPFAKRLNALSEIEVREAEHGNIIEPATVYIAPAGRHIKVQRRAESKTAICLSDHPFGTLHKPSADVLMLSVAETFGRYSFGIILTGMGADGLRGMTAIRRAGGITIGQDEASSAVYGMPRVCAESGILQRVVPLDQVPGQILQALRYQPRELNANRINRMDPIDRIGP
jgi:two-component system, chemotaxis family, protein-glutamate methylesterase/glutaminase